jgi:phosphoribosylanthranilate isomerase
MSKVKVCGITRESDALELDALGVEYLGFNFYSRSKRQVDAGKAAGIIGKLKNSIPVGIFVDEDLDQLKRITEQTGIKYAQLHGSESPEYISQVPIPVIKAVPGTDLEQAADWNLDGGEFLLFDTSTQGQFGGTGKTFDWQLLSGYQGQLPYFLAGGLGPENIKQALDVCRPYAVDLNSKVELSPGVKDLEKVKSCLNQIRD